MKNIGTLRNGYTTGSAASAAAVAAFRGSADPVQLVLPNGDTLTIPVLRACPGKAVVIKDGGDDPDVTTGAEIIVELSPFDAEPGTSDHLELAGSLELVIRGGEGVGRVTRPGLAVEPGKYAINPAPRKMLVENLSRAGCCGRYLAVISVPGGAKIAQKTLNPTLGIEDGISILGHSGIVRPYSNAAYAATVILQLKSAAASGAKRAAVVTGNRTTDAVMRDFPEIPEQAVVRIGDFIYCAVTAARNAKFESLVIGCMPGKLFKYSCGEHNTHAHKNKLTLTRLRESGVELPGVPLETMDSMGELAAHLDEKQYAEVLVKVYAKAKSVLSQWAGNTRTELVLYDDSGRRLL